MKSNLVRGIAAGFLATMVLTAVMVAKAAFRVMPEINVAALLSGLQNAPIYLDWLTHVVIGTLVFGPLFAVLAPRLPGATCVAKGILFAIGMWLIMQLLVLPVAGLGLFGMVYGFGGVAVTFVLYLVYGVVLGVAYQGMKGRWRTKGPGDDVHGALRYTHY